MIPQARKVDDSEKHLEELSKLKSEKAKTAYLKQLPGAQLCNALRVPPHVCPRWLKLEP